MLRQILSVSASVTLLAALAACGNDDKAGSSPPSTTESASGTPGDTASATPTDAPPVAWKQSPGQADKVKATLTAAKFSCSELKDQYSTFTVCSKPAKNSPLWMKYVAATDGTVLNARASAFEDVKPAITAIVGAADANVLLSNGDTIKWGYAGENWITINGMNSAYEPPQAKPFENTRADMVTLFKNDPAIRCTIEDPEPTETTPADPNEVTPSTSPTPVPSAIECQPRGYDANKVVWATMRFAGDALTEFSMRSEMNDIGASDSKELAEAKAQLLRSLNRLWPALKGGGDPQAIKTFVDAHLIAGGSTLAYVDGRRVRVDVIPGTGYAAKLKVEVTNEKVDLEEPKG